MLEELIVQFLSRLRTVRMKPFLLEVTPTPVGERFLQPDDPALDPEIVADLIPGVGGTLMDGIDYRLDSDGTLRARKEWEVSHAEACAMVSADGFRLPTSDEWEYACGAGSRTFFRWGDHIPSEYDAEPAESPEDDEWELPDDPIERAKLLLARLAEANQSVSEWDDPASVENAFGLFMTDPECRQEYCHARGILRSGDGGRFACGGTDLFTSIWLPRATAFVWRIPKEEWDEGTIRMSVRRCFPLE
jgi:hypothetical protein